MFVNSQPRILDLKRHELESLGFDVLVETQYKRALQHLNQSLSKGKPIAHVLTSVEPGNKSCMDFIEQLKSDTYRATFKLIAATRNQEIHLRSAGYSQERNFYFVDKPVGLFELEYTLYNVDEFSTEEPSAGHVIVFCREDRISASLNQAIKNSPANVKLGKPSDIESVLLMEANQVVIIDYDSLDDVDDLVLNIRNFETVQGRKFYMPIIGFSSYKSETDEKIYILGLDDFIDQAHNTKKSFEKTVAYWSSLYESP